MTPRSWVMKMTAMPVVALRFAQQFEDLRLDGDVEGGGGLVGDQDVRLARQRHGDHHPLAHAAGQLVRVFAQTLFGGGYAHLLEQPQSPAVHGVVGEIRLVQGVGLRQLATDPMHGVQRRHGFLEDHRDAVAADVAHALRGQAWQAGPLETDVAPRYAPGRLRQEAHDRQRGDTLAATRLADDAEGLARLDVEADPVNDGDRAALGFEGDGKFVDLKKRHRSCAGSRC